MQLLDWDLVLIALQVHIARQQLWLQYTAVRVEVIRSERNQLVPHAQQGMNVLQHPRLSLESVPMATILRVVKLHARLVRLASNVALMEPWLTVLMDNMRH